MRLGFSYVGLGFIISRYKDFSSCLLCFGLFRFTTYWKQQVTFSVGPAKAFKNSNA